ncbi:TPA: hypothetical protein N3414_001727 [Klebsiella quasipneumoniae subsp. quasipneumoniae]|nr:hypothetical protein [Escherichia coli]MBA1613616.1 hypothetical protein [Klebsiella pneumoniae]HBT6083148.1 hypothetical protein [Klebsiella quasipneumoniae]HBW1842985.1 hypothetical protein [Klebsiella quasipneumoniae subsp. quasipneumoniae]HCB0898980.1 hypothetical protein [Klebsiella variicola subsp. variicola]HDS4085356.1 hypothetical protein [Klebsiella pneumoniae subsp. pneumoniae]HDT1813240.1 hypothetical protein [Klebsiella variicola]
MRLIKTKVLCFKEFSMRYMAWFLLAISFCSTAKKVSNAKAVETYDKQLEQTKRMLNEVQQTLIASDAVITMYKNLGYITPEVKAVSRHLIILGENIQNLYGDTSLNPTPFYACTFVPSDAYNFWSERLSSIAKDNSLTLKAAANQYINRANDCVYAINNRPPKEIDESEQPQIIDVAP